MGLKEEKDVLLAKRKAEVKARGAGAFYLEVQGLGSDSILLFGPSRLGWHQGNLARRPGALRGGESTGRRAAEAQLGRSLHHAFPSSVPAAFLRLPVPGL